MANIVDISEILLLAGLSSGPTEEERGICQFCLMTAHGAVKRHLKYDPAYAERTEYYPNADVTRSGREAIWEVSDTQAFQRFASEASTNELQLQHIPVRSITSLHIDYDGRAGTKAGSFGAEHLKVLGTDYWPNFDSVDSAGNKICTDGIIKSQGLWPDSSGSVKVVYFAGFKENELRGNDEKLDASPIYEAVVEETIRRIHKVMSRKKSRVGFLGPLTSENLGDYSYTRDSALYARLVGGTDLLPETREKLQSYENYGWMLNS